MPKSGNTNKKKKISPMAANLQGRLVLMALQCPLVNGGSCGMAKRQSQAKGQRTERTFAPDELVTVHVALPYELRRQARKARLNCSALLREALRSQLRILADV